jgi:hypothetical protein
MATRNVDRDGDPDLGLHGIFGCPEEPVGGFNTEALNGGGGFNAGAATEELTSSSPDTHRIVVDHPVGLEGVGGQSPAVRPEVLDKPDAMKKTPRRRSHSAISSIERDYTNLLSLAISLEEMARDEIVRLSSERPNDRIKIENNKRPARSSLYSGRRLMHECPAHPDLVYKTGTQG